MTPKTTKLFKIPNNYQQKWKFTFKRDHWNGGRRAKLITLFYRYTSLEVQQMARRALLLIPFLKNQFSSFSKAIFWVIFAILIIN